MMRRVTELFTRAFTAAKARPLFLAAFFLAVLVPFVLFGELAEEILEGHGLPFDEPILRWFHAQATPARDRWVVTITNLGGPVPMLACEAVVVAALFLWRKRREAKFLAIASGGAALLNVCAKLIFSRQRPQLWETIVTEKSFSFPSGHSIGSMSFAAALTLLAWPTRGRWPVAIGALSFAGTIGLTRLYLGVHFPSDVAAGWCAALVWVGGVYTFQRWRRRPSRNDAGSSLSRAS